MPPPRKKTFKKYNNKSAACGTIRINKATVEMKKKNVTTQNKRGRAIAAAAIVGVAALALAIWGAHVAYVQLKGVYIQQCCVTDAGEQVEVITGK